MGPAIGTVDMATAAIMEVRPPMLALMVVGLGTLVITTIGKMDRGGVNRDCRFALRRPGNKQGLRQVSRRF